MAEFDNPHEDLFSDEELLLQEIQGQCARFADELLTLVAKRAVRIINSWGAFILPCADDYPNKFTTFDILCCEYQSKTWDEISPFLENAIDGALSQAYDSLSQKDKFFIEYSECYYNTRFLDSSEIDKLIRERLGELINQHWSASRKIIDFEEKRSW